MCAHTHSPLSWAPELSQTPSFGALRLQPSNAVTQRPVGEMYLGVTVSSSSFSFTITSGDKSLAKHPATLLYAWLPPSLHICRALDTVSTRVSGQRQSIPDALGLLSPNLAAFLARALGSGDRLPAEHVCTHVCTHTHGDHAYTAFLCAEKDVAFLWLPFSFCSYELATSRK